MKGIINLALAATLVAGASGAQHQHQHQHHRHHAKRAAGNHMEKRAPEVVTTYAQGPTVVVYELEGQRVDPDKAQAGIDKGLYSVVGETTPTFTPPPPPSTTSSSTSSSSTTSQAAQFIEQKSSSTPKPSAAAVAASTSASAKGLDAEFPNGTIPCTQFPSDWGAVPVRRLNLDGWLCVQDTGSWVPGVKISTIHQPISGGCFPNTFCSYSCPAGYGKTQWPETSQGATGQSIGGLWCNSAGFLELSRPTHKTLCEPGVGNVYVQNKLPGKSCVCQTNYPADEKMSIATVTEPDNTYPLFNPDAKSAYSWEGKHTSAQYYVNNLNVDVEDACTWKSDKYPDSAGNWAPVNIGVGRDIHGITYLSIFNNAPTSKATLDFDIEITGDITAPCALKGGVYTNGNGNGCTTAISGNGKATFVFTKSS